MKPTLDPKELRALVRETLPEIIEIRHALHRMPEPGFQEFKTSAFIREHAGRTRVRIRPPLAETDTVAVLDGGAPGGCVLLRADIDSLPLEDRTETPYASRHPGRAHACGHDGHSAMLLGAMKVLDRLADRLKGHVLFVFQPAEEGLGGGRLLVERGLLDEPPVPTTAFALHGWAGLAMGRLASRPGPMMAAQDRFSIQLIGRGGHGAAPHLTVDPVVLAAQVVTAFQTIPARILNPVRSAVLSVCTVQGGTASNIIPDEVNMTGTLRYFDEPTRKRMVDAMEATLSGCTAAAGATYRFTVDRGYIATLNDEAQTGFARDVVQAYAGTSAWEDLPDPSMGAEDFAYYLERIPGAMLRLGVGEDHPAIHNTAYDFSDDAMENGILTLVALAVETLIRAPGPSSPRRPSGPPSPASRLPR